ncbi:MAG: ShlB/FhaC/HecB family hemolysin secretion/activation protein [Synechococcales bacterium]|nr:ShlB/FhaC/HecB family hemolysin secretion/activation protein [Synechococcales bacterium]
MTIVTFSAIEFFAEFSRVGSAIAAAEAAAETSATVTPDHPSPNHRSPDASPPTPAAPAHSKVYIQQIKVLGSRVFREWELANVTQPFEDKDLSLEELQQVADLVTRYYLDHGYMTSRVVLADQTIENDTLYLQAIEGNLEAIEIEGTRRINPKYVHQRLMRAQRSPLNQDSLEQSLRLLKSDPLFSHVEASLREGKQAGNSILNVQITESKSWSGHLSIDNYNPSTIGALSVSGLVGLRNVSGQGDSLFAYHSQSLTGGSQQNQILYQRPLNAMQGTISLRFSPNHFKITQPELEEFNITGRSDLLELSIRQPIVRQPAEEIALSLSFVKQRGETSIADYLANSQQSTLLRFGQEILRRDYKGVWTAHSQFNFGRTHSETNAEGGTNFITWAGQLQRLQFLGKNHAVTLGMNWQFANQALPASQQFTLGGAQSLRGYPNSFLSGDNGISAFIEQQFVLQRDQLGQPRLKVSSLLDIGTVWNHITPDQNISKAELFRSLGLGVSWHPSSQWSIKVDVAFPLQSIANSPAFSPALYFQSHYQF